MRLDAEAKERIRRSYYLEHKSMRQIAREEGYSRPTIEKAIANQTPPPYSLTRPKPAPIFGPYKERVEALLHQNEQMPRKQRYTVHRIFEVIRDEGMSLYGPSIEEVVITAFFDAIRPAQLDALSALLIQRAKEEERLVQHHHDQVRRATYEAHLARRRYEAVDPDNRLVAASLERGWEEKLLAQRQAEEEAERFQQRPIFPTLAPELRQQLEQIGPALPALWTSGKISNEHKKRLLRSLISRVIATKIAVDLIEIKIVWVSGHFSLVQVIPPIHRQTDASNYQELIARIDLLTKQGLTDPEIAAQLSREGFHTARRGAVTVATIHKLRSRDDQVSASVLHQHRKVAMVNGYWTIPGLTRELGVGDNWLYSRIRQGRFSEADIQQLPNYRVYLIRNDPVLVERLRAEAVTSRRYDTTRKQSHS